MLLIVFAAIGHSQIVLEEAEVESTPPSSLKLDPFTRSLTIVVPENNAGEFQKDPLAFIKENFEIDRFIHDNKESGFDVYWVRFRMTDGKLVAQYDANGLVFTFQRFRNVNLSRDVRLDLILDYGKADILKNSHGYDSPKLGDGSKSGMATKSEELKLTKKNLEWDV